MRTSIFILAFVAVWINHSTNARSVQKDIQIQDASVPLYSYEDTEANFKDYNTDGFRFKRRYSQKPNPTTPKKSTFISYWQNIMRNLRVPVPSITWSLTNPLAKLFRIDKEIFETPPLENHHDFDNQRQKPKRRFRRPNKRYRKHKPPIKSTEEALRPYVGTQLQHFMLQQYYTNNNCDLSSVMYFYDPKMDAYFAVQRLRARGPYIEDPFYNPILAAANEQDHQEQSEELIKDEMYEAPETENVSEYDTNLVANEENDLNKVAEENSLKQEFSFESNEAESINDLINQEATQCFEHVLHDAQYNRMQQRTKELKNNNNQSKWTKNKLRNQPNYYLLLNVG